MCLLSPQSLLGCAVCVLGLRYGWRLMHGPRNKWTLTLYPPLSATPIPPTPETINLSNQKVKQRALWIERDGREKHILVN